MSLEAEPLGQAGQHARVAPRAAPEAMVEADHDLARVQAGQQHVLHERLGLDRRQLAGEGQHDGGVHARLRDEPEPLVERGDRRRRPVGLEDLRRMAVEGAGQRDVILGASARDSGAEDRAVGEMDAVEDAQRDRRRP